MQYVLKVNLRGAASHVFFVRGDKLWNRLATGNQWQLSLFSFTLKNKTKQTKKSRNISTLFHYLEHKSSKVKLSIIYNIMYIFICTHKHV